MQLNLAARGRPDFAALAVAICDLRLLRSRYPTGLSLAWRDAGALLAIAQLVATDLNVSSTIVGATAWVTDDSAETELEQFVWVLGALAIGGDMSQEESKEGEDRDVTGSDNL
jgi:hypothetical protein